MEFSQVFVRSGVLSSSNNFAFRSELSEGGWKVWLDTVECVCQESGGRIQTFIIWSPPAGSVGDTRGAKKKHVDHTGERTYFISNNDRIMCATVWFMHGDWTNTRRNSPRKKGKQIFMCRRWRKEAKKNWKKMKTGKKKTAAADDVLTKLWRRSFFYFGDRS